VNFVPNNQRLEQRKRVAQEAALLLYTGQEKEYKQAKFRAAKNLGTHTLPSNIEIALEFDRIAEEREGDARQKRLVRRRQQALEIMQILKEFHPVLVGSVWRGTSHRNSDIDVKAFGHNPQHIVSKLHQSGYAITKTKVQTITKRGMKKQSFHIYIGLPQNNQAEIVVRSPADNSSITQCEIYGDKITGLTIQQLQQIMKENPAKRFVPK
jgi:predicted nucleotidyltransferase